MRMLRVASVMIAAGIFSAGLALAATAATVTCKDGTTATGGRGACHGHGGVDKSASSGSAKSAPTAAAEPEATVTCKDGATSKGGRGACHGHGGIAKAGAAESAPEAEGAVTTVTCKDGATSKGGRGACHGHGGVAKAGETVPAAPRASRTPPAVPPTGEPARTTTHRETPPAQVAATTHGKAASTDPTSAIARCKDGVYWHSSHHQGACSRHGGVDSWMDGTR
jgi:Protein of unknown function (DUF3761)